MKILHVCKKYPNARAGDAVAVANLQKHQEIAGHQVVILTSNCPEVRGGENIYKFGLRDSPAALDNITPKRLISIVLLTGKAFWVLRHERPDVIHTHSVDLACAVSLAARCFRVPLVHTFHIVLFYRPEQSLIRRKTELWFARLASPRIITAPNACDTAQLQQAGFKQTVVLPNGVDVDFWEPRSPGTQNESFTFISIGRLEQQKGYDYLMHAAAILAKKSDAPRFRIVIIGEGSQKTELRRLADNSDISDIVELPGAQSPEYIRTQLASADAAIFPSLYETTPITLLEAWAAALPVIMTPVGILQGKTADTHVAYLVPPADAKALADAMERCMHDAEFRARIAAHGHQEARKYAWPAIAKDSLAMYEDVQ